MHIPAVDVHQSAAFYEQVFGWAIRRRESDHPGFDDGNGHVSGTWVTDQAISREPGLLPYIYVDHIDTAIERIQAQGGEVVTPPYPEGNLWVATFRDPAGNVIGLWQEGARRERCLATATTVQDHKQETHKMSNATPLPEPIKTSIAPWLSVSRAVAALSFYQAAFGAVERYRLEDETGKVVVAQLAIKEADFWIQEDSHSSQEPQDHRLVRMILTVADPDAVFEQALAAGAMEVYVVSEEHGWRMGRLVDPFGHHWEIGKPMR